MRDLRHNFFLKISDNLYASGLFGDESDKWIPTPPISKRWQNARVSRLANPNLTWPAKEWSRGGRGGWAGLLAAVHVGREEGDGLG